MNQWLSLHSSWTSGVGWLDRLERLPIHLWWWRVDSDPQGQGDGSGTNLILRLFKKWIWFSILSRVLIHTWSRMNCALCIFTMSFHLDLFSTFLMESRCPLLSLFFHSQPLAMLHPAPRQGEGQSCEGSTKDTRAHLSVGHQMIKPSWLYRGLN